MSLHGPHPRLVIDVETFSTIDLAKAGAHAYAEHPSTDIHCLAWRIKSDRAPPVSGVWRPGDGDMPRALRDHVSLAWPVVAHNWLFELNIWEQILARRYSWSVPPMAVWSCTMARALYHGLPAGLDELGVALRLNHMKDASQRANMLRLSRPRSTRSDGTALSWWHLDPVEGPPRLAKLVAYCQQDVASECEADDNLPELPEHERDVFLMDAEANQRGVAIDLELIAKLQGVIDHEGARLNEDMHAATSGRVSSVNQVGLLKIWLQDNGCTVDGLDKGAVADALTWASPTTRPALLIRQEAAKASTAKLRAMRAAVSRDGRARGMFQYYGAGRTGRWAGRRAQFQNYVRPTIPQKLVELAVDWAMRGRHADAFRMMFPTTPMDVVASCLRACLQAAPGHVLVSVDLAQIEARVVAWLAGQADLLDVFAKGEDVYVYTAAKVGSTNRQLGKVLVLACGFGMGWPKFQTTALTYGLRLTDADAQTYVGDWRGANRKIVAFWYALGDAFARVAESPSGTWERLGFLQIGKTGKAVRIRLPSGRELVYQRAAVEDNEDGRPEITFYGVGQLTRKWEKQRTYGGKLAENVTQAVARDVMAAAMVKLRRRGRRIVGSIHDEALLEALVHEADAIYRECLAFFRLPPPWAPGLPVNAEGWVGPRYRKG